MTSRIDSDPEPGIEIRLLGSPAVVSAGECLSIPSRKATALLAYLAMRPDERISRDHLAGLLWGESANEQARANLRQALTQLRRLFRGAGVDPIKTPSDKVMLSSEGLTIDAHRLARVDAILDSDRRHWEKEFLEGFSIAEPEFERWLTVQRESLRSRVRRLHEAAAEDAFQERRIDEAIDHLTIALSLDPLQEHLHRRLITLFAAEGRADAAMAQFERCRSVLAQELGIEPDHETTALYQEIRSQRITEDGDLAEREALPFDSRIPTINPPPMVSDKPSIAVLAFENMGGDQEQEYFSDGIVEDVAYFAVAAAALWMKQHQRAAVAAAKCLAISPNFAEGHAVLGLILVYSGKPHEAIASLHRAMRLDPHYRDIFLHLLALAHVQLEEYEQAVAVLKRRLVRKPESDISRVLLAATHGHLGNIEESRTQWAEALRINPDYSLDHRRNILPYRNPADFEHLLDGLRRAGLVESADCSPASREFPPMEL